MDMYIHVFNPSHHIVDMHTYKCAYVSHQVHTCQSCTIDISVSIKHHMSGIWIHGTLYIHMCVHVKTRHMYIEWTSFQHLWNVYARCVTYQCQPLSNTCVVFKGRYGVNNLYLYKIQCVRHVSNMHFYTHNGHVYIASSCSITLEVCA